MKKQKFSEFLDKLKNLIEVQRVALRELLGKTQDEKSPATVAGEKFASKSAYG